MPIDAISLRGLHSAPPSTLENVEKLEQLRAIEAGKKIIVARVDCRGARD